MRRRGVRPRFGLVKPRETTNNGQTRYYSLTLTLDGLRDADLIAAIENTPNGQFGSKVRELMRSGLRPEVKTEEHTPEVELDGIGGDL